MYKYAHIYTHCYHAFFIDLLSRAYTLSVSTSLRFASAKYPNEYQEGK